MRHRELLFPPAALFLLLAAFYVMNLASCLWSINLGEALFESQKVFMGLCTVAFFLNYIRTGEEEILLVKSFLWIILFACVLNSAELLYAGPRNLDTVTGFSENRVLNASFLMLMIPFTIYAIFFLRGAYFVFATGLFFWLLLLISALCVKSVCLATSVGLLLIALAGFKMQTRFKGRIFLGVSAILALIIFWLLLKDILLPLVSDAPLSTLIPQEKQSLWKKTWRLFLENSWWGVGAANWPFYIMSEGVQDLPSVVRYNIRFLRPENDLLWVLAETGLICFMILLLKMCTILYYSGREIFWQKNLRVLIFFSFLCALIIQASFSYPKERTTHIVMSCLLLALLLRNLSPGTLMTTRSRFLLYLGLVILTCGFMFGLIRFFSENNSKKMNQAAINDQPREVIFYGDKALCAFYETQPDGRPVTAQMAAAYDKLGIADSACLYYERAIRSSPYDFEVLYNYSRTLKSVNDAGAQTMLGKALEINPDLETTLAVD